MTLEHLYKNLFHLSPEAIVIVDAKGRILDANKRLEEWLGYPPEEVKGVNAAKMPFLSLKSKAIVAKKLMERLAGKEVGPYEVDVRKKDGSTVVGRVYGRVVKDEDTGEKYDLVMISNVTDEARVKVELEEKVKELQRINSMMVDRELKMKELKAEIEKLKAE